MSYRARRAWKQGGDYLIAIRRDTKRPVWTVYRTHDGGEMSWEGERNVENPRFRNAKQIMWHQVPGRVLSTLRFLGL